MKKERERQAESARASRRKGANPRHPGNVDQERRDALVKIGRFGAYTAPALLALLTSSKMAAAS